jgi:hypothetical protein
MNGLMAFSTNDQCLSSAGSHHTYPQWLVSSPWFLQISQLANMMHFHLLSGLAQFAGIR